MSLLDNRPTAGLCVLAIALAGAGPDTTTVVDTGRILNAARGDAAFTVEHFQLAADTTVDLELQRFHVTGPGTRFVVGSVAGDDVAWDFDPDRVTLLRGHVAGEPDSHVFMALSEWGSSGRIDHGGTQYALSGDATTMAVSRPVVSGALSPDVPFCGAVVAAPGQRATPPALPAGVLPEITQQIEMAIETDYELFQLFGDLDATGAYMVELWGAVSDIYLRDVNTRVVLSFVRLWDNPDDLFNAENPLSDFRDYWEANMGAVDRDVAQFVSGRRDMPYGGAAYLSALCGNAAYGVVGYMIGHFDGLDVPSVFGYDIQVTAHELGHNAGTLHTHDYGLDTCQDTTGAPQRGTIMSYCSQTRSGANGNTDLRFHTFVQQQMRNHIFFEVTCVVDDCNDNGVDDALDISRGDSQDDNSNGIADECEDCNGNSTLDPEDISLGNSFDLNGNGVPDECDPDCNGNNVPDDRDILLGTDTDLHGNGIPDGCETDCNGNGTSDYNEIQVDMSLDIDRNAMLDACQDCDGDQISDLDALEGAHNTWIASTSPGAPLGEYHAVSGVKMAESTGGGLSSPQDLIITADRRILVSSSGCDCVLEYDRDGLYVADLVASGSGGLNYPTGLVISPTGSLLVASSDTDSVLEYDAINGAFLGEFVSPGSGGLFSPWGIAFGPNGNLFVASLDMSVIEYDGLTGSLIGAFVTTADNGGMLSPHGLLFKPDGNLLVASRLTDQILEFDGLTGAFIGQFNHGGTAVALTLDQPWTLRLAPDGDVYVSRHLVSVPQGLGPAFNEHDDVAELHINSTRIYIFDVDSGNFVRSYVTGHDTGLSLPASFDFMPGDMTDCNYNLLPDACDITSGFSRDVNGNGTPDECESSCPGDIDGDGTVGINDFLDLLAAWGPNPGHPADLDGDGVVGINDFLDLLAAWGPCV